MAIFSNQATLSYNGILTNSNIAYGEILEVLVITKTAVEGSYAPGEVITYVVTLRNTGASALTGLVVTDDLGGFLLNGATVYPLTYVADSAALFVDGVPQAAPVVMAGPPLQVTGLSVPAGGDAVLVYQARANSYANPAQGGSITNTATVSGGGITAPLTASETVEAGTAAQLTISKSITPAQVTDNDRVTYTFVIQNTGNAAVVATDNAIVTDLFDPILTDLAVSYNGAPWTENIQYTYDDASGQFATLPGQIVVPAATYTRDPLTGTYALTPGIATLVVTGTI